MGQEPSPQVSQGLEVLMEEASTGKKKKQAKSKGKMPTYMHQSGIKAATHFRKVLEERILINNKVEST